MNYCGFKTPKKLQEDHKKIKEQIKSRETKLDKLLAMTYSNNLRALTIDDMADTLEDLVHEMMAVNM